VFVSLSATDEPFARDLTNELSRAKIPYRTAERDIEPASVWAEATWELIRHCKVFLCIVTPEFLKSRWFLLEAGAACACQKKVFLALRYVKTKKVPVPLDRFQSLIVQNNEQLGTLITKLRKMV
jgi:hypothetical protein